MLSFLEFMLLIAWKEMIRFLECMLLIAWIGLALWASFLVKPLSKEPLQMEAEVKVEAYISTVGPKVVVRKLEGEKETKGGIILPDGSKGSYVRGIVIACGAGHLTDNGFVPMEVKTGNEVIFNVHATNEIEVEGEKFNVVREQDILAVIRRPAGVEVKPNK